MRIYDTPPPLELPPKKPVTFAAELETDIVVGVGTAIAQIFTMASVSAAQAVQRLPDLTSLRLLAYVLPLIICLLGRGTPLWRRAARMMATLILGFYPVTLCAMSLLQIIAPTR
jgi:hypothetical protein